MPQKMRSWKSPGLYQSTYLFLFEDPSPAVPQGSDGKQAGVCLYSCVSGFRALLHCHKDQMNRRPRCARLYVFEIVWQGLEERLADLVAVVESFPPDAQEDMLHMQNLLMALALVRSQRAAGICRRTCNLYRWHVFVRSRRAKSRRAKITGGLRMSSPRRCQTFRAARHHRLVVGFLAWFGQDIPSREASQAGCWPSGLVWSGAGAAGGDFG